MKLIQNLTFVLLAIFLVGYSSALTTPELKAQATCISTDGTFAVAASTKAECDAACAAAGVTCNFTLYGSSGSNGLSGSSGGTVAIVNPLGENDPRVIIGNIIRVVLGIVGSLALIIFIYGGLTWMTSSGNTERIKRGRDTLVWATIGLMVIFGSYTVVNFVIQSLTKN